MSIIFIRRNVLSQYVECVTITDDHGDRDFEAQSLDATNDILGSNGKLYLLMQVTCIGESQGSPTVP